MTFSIKSVLAVTATVALTLGIIHAQIQLRKVTQQRGLYDWSLSDAESYIRLFKEHDRFDGPAFARTVEKGSDKPKSGVIVNLTLIGPDGGDGGFQQFLTDADGYAHLKIPMMKGRYQYHLDPGPNSQFAHRL